LVGHDDGAVGQEEDAAAQEDGFNKGPPHRPVTTYGFNEEDVMDVEPSSRNNVFIDPSLSSTHYYPGGQASVEPARPAVAQSRYEMPQLNGMGSWASYEPPTSFGATPDGKSGVPRKMRTVDLRAEDQILAWGAARESASVDAWVEPPKATVPGVHIRT